MSANRLSWVVATLVVLIVGFLVFRTLRNDTTTRPASMSMPPRSETSSSGSEMAPRPAGSDTARARSPEQRISSVERAKKVLQEGGYYRGPIDGNYDAPMIEALKRFQADKGMKPTGYLDPQTYTAMGIELRRKRP